MNRALCLICFDCTFQMKGLYITNNMIIPDSWAYERGKSPNHIYNFTVY